MIASGDHTIIYGWPSKARPGGVRISYCGKLPQSRLPPCQPSPVLSIRKHFVQRLLNLLKAGAKGCLGGTRTLRSEKSSRPPRLRGGWPSAARPGGVRTESHCGKLPQSRLTPCQPSPVLSIRKHFVQRLLNLLKAGAKGAPGGRTLLKAGAEGVPQKTKMRRRVFSAAHPFKFASKAESRPGR